MSEETWEVGGFEVLGVLGRGGMGIVYRARQPSMGREVALKEMSLGAFGNPDFAPRFLQEARIGGSLAHPSIVTVHDYFEVQGAAYIAMEYLERGPLTPWMHRLALPQIAGVLESVLAALAFAGRRGIVHRDLKPANLLLTGEGRIKVADFGIAKALDTTQALALTATNQALGTPAYMSPEQALGSELDPRSDLYAVGVIGYEMLTGQPPFDPSLPLPTLMYKHVHEPVPDPRSIVPELSDGLVAWLKTMLAKAPANRPADAATAWTALEEAVVEAVGWRWRHSARLDSDPSALQARPVTPPPFSSTDAEPVADEYKTYADPPLPQAMSTADLVRDLGRDEPAAAPAPEPASEPEPAAEPEPPAEPEPGAEAPEPPPNEPEPATVATAAGASPAPAHRSRVPMVMGGLVALSIAALIAVAAIALSGGDDPPPGTDAQTPTETAAGTAAAGTATAAPTTASVPAAKQADLTKAAKAAGCKVVSAPIEGFEHEDRDFTGADYKTNPPTSGNHNPEFYDDGIYDPGEVPRLGELVHPLEHGRVEIQYAPGTPQGTVDQLKALVNSIGNGYHILMYENTTDMPFAVAAAAWGHYIGCPKMNDDVFDALRDFHAKYVDKGPEIIP